MKVYLVGGAVRDKQLGLAPKERDWCVVGSTPEALMAEGYKAVGKDFPVFLHPETGEEYALAHQKLYISGDSGFNESFATSVAEIGLKRWVEANGISRDDEFDGSLAALQEEVRNLVDAAREDLEELYASEMGLKEMRKRKKVIMDRLSSATQASIDASGTNVPNWLAAPLNNARLVPMSLYEGNLPAFREIFSGCGRQLSCFYAKTAELAGLEYEQRQKSLAALGAGMKPDLP